MSPEEFEKTFGFKPENDDIERAECPDAGLLGHFNCGVCPNCGMPRYTPSCTTQHLYDREGGVINMATVYTKEFLDNYEVQSGAFSYDRVAEIKKLCRQLRKEGWTVEYKSYSSFVSYSAIRPKEVQREKVDQPT